MRIIGCYVVSLVEYKQEQEMEIEALEAILMDEFKGEFFLVSLYVHH